MDIVKYFYKEPAALHGTDASVLHRDEAVDPLASDLHPNGPVVYRAYLAGTHLPDGEGDVLRIGATALDCPASWADPLLALFSSSIWTLLTTEGEVVEAPNPIPVLCTPGGVAALVAAASPVGETRLKALSGGIQREAVPALYALLAEARAVLFPEPAHDGMDWSIVASVPLCGAFVEACRRHPAPDARRFVLPYRRARGEHRFYFEQWQLDALPDFVEEV